MLTHLYQLEPIEKWYESILLQAGFNTKGTYTKAQNEIICKLRHALNDVGVQVIGASYNGDEVSVITFCKELHAGGTEELSI